MRELSADEAAPFQRQIDNRLDVSVVIRAIGSLATEIGGSSAPTVEQALRELADNRDFQRLAEAVKAKNPTAKWRWGSF